MHETIPVKKARISVFTVKNKRILMLFLALILFPLFCLVSCEKFYTETEQPQDQQIIANTIAAMEKVKSCSLNTFLMENYIIIDGSNTSATADVWQWAGLRKIDISKQEMYSYIDNREASSLPASAFITESYISGGWEYINQITPPTHGLVNPWIKTRLDEESEITFANEAQLAAQIELLKSSNIFGLVDTESINGIECYTINLAVSAEAAADWVLSQQQEFGPSFRWFRTDMESSKEIYIKAFKNGSVRLWIEKDNCLILKLSINIIFDGMPGNITRYDTPLEITEETDPLDVGFKHIIRDFSGQWEFSNYNQPVHIQLPEEALNATEHP